MAPATALDTAVPGSDESIPITPPATRRRRRHVPWSLRISGAIAMLLVVLVVVGPWLTGDTETSELRDRLLGFAQQGHLLGTDGQGRDILARLVAGARPSLLAGIIPVLVAGIVGTALGIIAGLGSKVTHGAIMRTLDVFYAFPAILLAIAIGAALGPGVLNAVISLSVVLTPPVARLAETETLRLRDLDFMESARASGAGRLRTGWHHVVPNIAPNVIVYCTTLMGLGIVAAAGLSFLGLGVAPPHAEWGLMIDDLRQYIFSNASLALAPAAAIFVASVTFSILGDGLRTFLDVRQEAIA